jgi:hemoglobin
MTQSLYERLGGEAAIVAAVDLFYEKVLADPRTREFFVGLDMKAQTRKQVSFMTWAFGGPAENRGRDLRAAHAKLVRERGLSDVHFDAVAQHLQQTLRELGVTEDLIGEALGIVAGTRANVLNR